MLVGPEGLKWAGPQQDALKPLNSYRAPVKTVFKRKEDAYVTLSEFTEDTSL